MIPKEAIEKAIALGWDNDTAAYAGDMSDGDVEVGSYRYAWQVVALDPSFWQALGKALGWQTTYKTVGGKMRTIGEENYKEHAHRFYDLILTNQPTKDFWHSLLKV